MVYYLIICRSLTYAQRTAAALERAGIDPGARGETLSAADFARLADALGDILTETLQKH